MFVFFLAFAAALLPITRATALSPHATISGGFPGATSTASLNTVAKASGKLYFGSATDNPELTDSAYVAILSDNTMFGQTTPTNSMKWVHESTEPERGTFTFEGGDQIASLVKANGQLLRGHNCVWHNQLPSWVTDGNFDASTLQSIIETHCGTVVGHYKGQTYAWDVVNEPFNDDGTFREDVFFNTLNTSYIATALNTARQADPATKLYINDFNIEGAKATAMQNLVKSLQEQKVPIDGVGLQCHFIVGEVPTTLQANMEAFTALGIEIAITELDVRMTLPVTDKLLTQQKADYESVISACNAVPGCIGVTLWDYTDKFSWVPGAFAGEGEACPWDANLEKKPAFDGIVNGFA
ncbi:endo-1,4-beta-xylanase A precursor [Amylostereum chailletii]|nr:endo-1,4-beta-xylanase A precursor [Amylostereum chailletii]